MADDFSLCMVSNSRMAARAITRRYDAYLRPFGMTATQLSLLGGLREMAGATVSEIAEARGFDRTTLTRNLDRLEAMGIVASRHPDHGNGRISEITPKGDGLARTIAAAVAAGTGRNTSRALTQNIRRQPQSAEATRQSLKGILT